MNVLESGSKADIHYWQYDLNKYYFDKYDLYLPLLKIKCVEKTRRFEMDLNINSPVYYKNIYGVDDEIYLMCRDISAFVKDKKYSDIVDIVGISPVVAPKELTENGQWKEEIKYDLKFKLISVRKQIDFEKYINSNADGKCKLISGNILKSIKSISRKAKIDYNQFEKDLLEFLKYTKDDVFN